MNCKRCGEKLFEVRLGGFNILYICKFCEPEVWKHYFKELAEQEAKKKVKVKFT